MAKLRLRELVPQRVDLGPEPQVIVEMGSPANVILKAADDTASDLIVIGARGTGAISQPFRIGRTQDRVPIRLPDAHRATN